MYDKAKTKQEFWTVFGQYMAPVLSAEGNRTNWINYKTGIKHIYFRMEAENGYVSIAIELRHPDPGQQQDYFNRLLSFKKLFHDLMKEVWDWEPLVKDQSGSIISRISKRHTNINLYNHHDWPAIISFLKPRIIALDHFWNNVKDMLE
jgi:hypothetical protein